MNGKILRTARPGLRVTLALALVVTLGLGLLLTFSYGVLAEDTDATPEATAVPAEPPLGDCYGGVLLHAPLHCYALEQAEAAGVIDVDSIYLVGKRLYIFVGGEVGEEIPDYFVTTGNPTVGSDVYLGIVEEMNEYARLWPAWVDIDKSIWPYVCDPTDSDAQCLVKKLPVGVKALLDDVEGYDSLYLRAGTEEGRTILRGWAAWTRLWPATQQAGGQDDAGSGRGERAPIPTSFDISDVDTTNFPELDCSLAQDYYQNPCEAWEWGVEYGLGEIVGLSSTTPVIGRGNTLHRVAQGPR